LDIREYLVKKSGFDDSQRRTLGTVKQASAWPIRRSCLCAGSSDYRGNEKKQQHLRDDRKY
jgi:hypothetical protein